MFWCDLEDPNFGGGGGNLVSYSNGVEGGIGFEWVSNSELRILTHPEAQLAILVRPTPTRVQIYDRLIDLEFGTLPLDHPEFGGCNPT